MYCNVHCAMIMAEPIPVMGITSSKQTSNMLAFPHLVSTVLHMQMAHSRATPRKHRRQGFRLPHPKTASLQPLGSTHQQVTWHQGNSLPPHQMPGLMLTHRWPAEHPRSQLLAAVQRSPLPCLQVLQLSWSCVPDTDTTLCVIRLRAVD